MRAGSRSFSEILDPIMDLDPLSNLDNANLLEVIRIEIKDTFPVDIVPLECSCMVRAVEYTEELVDFIVTP